MRAILFASLLLAACASSAGGDSPQPPRSELAQQIRDDLARLDRELAAPGVVAAGIGQPANLGNGLSVRPLEVVEDSRCAANVQCVWAGRLRLRAEISGAISELTVGEPLQTERGTVVLAVVKPGAWHDWPTSEIGPPPAYRFGFRRQ